ncbi:hypothetical protein CEXT_106541 [Caerostris extrusa]|uniref:Uncharacterized protein n=1 Tax=Caerostris extrusa TaxID=172846 RepID=A0AAV4QHM3_CAEEX|nr:hypothetical protein CEXT_106541 [Caerostris extrusa]
MPWSTGSGELEENKTYRLPTAMGGGGEESGLSWRYISKATGLACLPKIEADPAVFAVSEFSQRRLGMTVRLSLSLSKLSGAFFRHISFPVQEK